MAMIRDPRGREFDRDLGPSGHAYSGHHFLGLGEISPPSDREKNNAHQAKYRAANRDAVNRRKRKPRCGAVMPMWGDRCDRPVNHSTSHRSVLWDRHGNYGRVDEPRDGQVLDNGGVQATTTEDRP